MPLELLDLSKELILIILEYVHETSPHTSRSIAQVNKYFHDEIQAIHNRRKTLFVQNRSPLRWIESKESSEREHEREWIWDTTILDGIRHLTIDYSFSQAHSRYQENDLDNELICNLIKRIKNLQTVTWNIRPLSEVVLNTLKEKSPNPKLRVFNYCRNDPELNHLTKDELAISTYKNLTDFRANIVRDRKSEPNHCISVFKEMFANSQSLQYAGMTDGSPQSHANGQMIEVSNDYTDEYTPLTDTKRRGSVKNLTFNSRWLTLSKSFLEDLASSVDIAHLESLKFLRGEVHLDYFQRAASMLPNIKHVSLNFSTMRRGVSTGAEFNLLKTAAIDYLLTCSPLISLSLWEASELEEMDKLINHHCTNIETLQIHNKWSSSYREILSKESVSLIREKCQKLRDLTLDLNRVDLPRVGRRPDKVGNMILDRCPEQTLAILDELKLFEGRLAKLQFYIDGVNTDLTQPLPSCLDDQGIIHGEDDNGNRPDGGDDRNHDIRSNIDGDADSEEDSDQSDESFDAEELGRRELAWGGIMQNFAEDIWKRIFGGQTFGERAVDVIFGEREAERYWYFQRSNRWFEIRPHERDDRPGEYFVKTGGPYL